MQLEKNNSIEVKEVEKKKSKNNNERQEKKNVDNKIKEKELLEKERLSFEINSIKSSNSCERKRDNNISSGYSVSMTNNPKNNQKIFYF